MNENDIYIFANSYQNKTYIIHSLKDVGNNNNNMGNGLSLMTLGLPQSNTNNINNNIDNKLFDNQQTAQPQPLSINEINNLLQSINCVYSIDNNGTLLNNGNNGNNNNTNLNNFNIMNNMNMNINNITGINQNNMNNYNILNGLTGLNGLNMNNNSIGLDLLLESFLLQNNSLGNIDLGQLLLMVNGINGINNINNMNTNHLNQNTNCNVSSNLFQPLQNLQNLNDNAPTNSKVTSNGQNLPTFDQNNIQNNNNNNNFFNILPINNGNNNQNNMNNINLNVSSLNIPSLPTSISSQTQQTSIQQQRQQQTEQQTQPQSSSPIIKTQPLNNNHHHVESPPNHHITHHQLQTLQQPTFTIKEIEPNNVQSLSSSTNCKQSETNMMIQNSRNLNLDLRTNGNHLNHHDADKNGTKRASCHQCKTKKDVSILFYCTKTRPCSNNSFKTKVYLYNN